MRSARPGRAVASPQPVLSLASAVTEAPRLRVLDVRDGAVFARGHLPDAGRMALTEFADRRIELPSREVPLLVVHDERARARAAAEALALLGYARVLWLDAPLAGEPLAHASLLPAARLWSPSPFLERVHERAPRGRALDLASGSGRAAVYLALAGWQAEAWDLDPSALALASSFAEREGTRITTRQVDLESGTLAPAPGSYELIVVVRYLHRPLFAWIERALAPGGVLVYETFCRGQERFGRPTRDRHLLEPGELTRAFPSLVVELHEESALDQPPVMARLLARRPG